MHYKAIKAMVLTTIVASLTGCASYVVPKPGNITLQNAMQSVGEGFKEMKKAEGDLRTGLIPDEVEVTFNISASGEQGGQIYVEASPLPTFPVQGKAGGEASTKYTAQRGNQITIKFKNLVFADPSKTMLKDPETAQKMLDILRDPKNKDGVFFIPP